MRNCANCGHNFPVSEDLTECPKCNAAPGEFSLLEDLLVPDPEGEKQDAPPKYADLRTIAKINRQMELTIQEPGSVTEWITSDMWVPLAGEMD